mmetsp:Transcript_10685/g.32182  ORF Transcript_10685/g.32182 Transcript_10685/m.32182 type:complete len:258 (-) Transcript_10685:268-1041(-)
MGRRAAGRARRVRRPAPAVPRRFRDRRRRDVRRARRRPDHDAPDEGHARVSRRVRRALRRGRRVRPGTGLHPGGRVARPQEAFLERDGADRADGGPPRGRPRPGDGAADRRRHGAAPDDARVGRLHAGRDAEPRDRDAGRRVHVAPTRRRARGQAPQQGVLPPVRLPAVVRGRDGSHGRAGPPRGGPRRARGEGAPVRHAEFHRVSVRGPGGVVDHRVVWLVVHGVGLRRLPRAPRRGRAALGQRRRRRHGRAARRP